MPSPRIAGRGAGRLLVSRRPAPLAGVLLLAVLLDLGVRSSGLFQSAQAVLRHRLPRRRPAALRGAAIFLHLRPQLLDRLLGCVVQLLQPLTTAERAGPRRRPHPNAVDRHRAHVDQPRRDQARHRLRQQVVEKLTGLGAEVRQRVVVHPHPAAQRDTPPRSCTAVQQPRAAQPSSVAYSHSNIRIAGSIADRPLDAHSRAHLLVEHRQLQTLDIAAR